MKQRIVHGAEIDAATRDEVEALLREFATAGHVAFGSDSIEKKLEDWPVKGHQRQVAVNRSHGDSNLVLAANVPTDLLPHEGGRAGLSIINIGANPCFVFLATAQDAKDRSNKVACGYLFAGGSWDGKISGELWVGAVSLLSVLGTTIVWAEI